LQAIEYSHFLEGRSLVRPRALRTL
jgi:hypothetical protein